MKWSQRRTLLSAVLCGTLLLAGCGSSQTAANSAGSGGSQTAATVGSAEQESTTQVITGALAAMTLEDMIGQSTQIVRGEVTAQSEPFQIKPVTGGDASNFTDYTVSVSEVLRGDDTKTVTVRVQGGTVGGMSTVAEDAPELPADTELLLFLNSPNMGGTYNTEGDYCYVTGLYRGVYVLDSSGEEPVFRNERNSTDADFTDTLKPDEIANTIRTYTQAHPVDKNAQRDQEIAKCKEDLASGAMTQEQYEEEIKAIDTYATIIT